MPITRVTSALSTSQQNCTENIVQRSGYRTELVGLQLARMSQRTEGNNEVGEIMWLGTVVVWKEFRVMESGEPGAVGLESSACYHSWEKIWEKYL